MPFWCFILYSLVCLKKHYQGVWLVECQSMWNKVYYNICCFWNNQNGFILLSIQNKFQ